MLKGNRSGGLALDEKYYQRTLSKKLRSWTQIFNQQVANSPLLLPEIVKEFKKVCSCFEKIFYSISKISQDLILYQAAKIIRQ